MELGEALTIFLELCLSCLIILFAWKRIKKGGKLPPGPTPIPFLGNLLQVHPDATFQSFMKLREKYGPVFTVYLGPRPVVVLCGHEAVKEALVDQGDEFSGRGELAIIERNFQGHGVVMANGDRWKILRRFSLTILRDFGMGKRSIEERIQEEAGYLLEELRKTKGAPIEPTFFLSRTVSNVISSVVFGSRFDYEDKQFLHLLQLMNENFFEFSTPWTQLYNMFPGIMQYLPGRHNRIYYLTEELKDFVASKVKINEASLDPQNPRDFIDCFLIKMHQDQNNPHTEFNHKNLVLTTLNLLFAGTETVSSTLRYGFLLLMKYPEVEAKIHEEIDQVIGPQRIPSVNDRVKMPYTDAVIHEIQRLLDFVPLGVPHKVTQDTHFRGYLLPKGTDVFPVLGSVLKDPKYFRYPDAFYPQHFLDEQGRFKKSEAFVAFSSGKRICLGKTLGRMELFLYFTSVLQNFSLRPLVPPADIDITPKVSGFGNIPPTYELCLVPR
ncbi:cytochrome P450 2G1-like isoform X2 [Nycticebus coucang]|nr:cytochrome P450 2G1-like isoform X2 [Nycticebus coucang]XP_053462267.1 cytochrome P450 2G1-like isoform X2 [Nycticebus coucang]XP_053462349.1 cytochrome P450 2G1-like isoform X2 [Nycticebus coucang]XP_053462350.1 cytochrome P450 2G1-like isoform X2 [Nycticebus coucang]